MIISKSSRQLRTVLLPWEGQGCVGEESGLKSTVSDWNCREHPHLFTERGGGRARYYNTVILNFRKWTMNLKNSHGWYFIRYNHPTSFNGDKKATKTMFRIKDPIIRDFSNEKIMTFSIVRYFTTSLHCKKIIHGISQQISAWKLHLRNLPFQVRVEITAPPGFSCTLR